MKVKIHCELDVSFYDYDSKQLNQKAVQYILRYVRETLRDELSYIPICVEEGWDGCSKGTTKIKVKLSEKNHV